MDYQRIYTAFIADRKAKPKPAGYVERHHILPRSLGGGDQSSNLIALTAEDHFFAHILLAKVHGGRMWAPVALMIGGQRKDWNPVRSRREYGWAKREMAAGISGENAHQFDWREHRLIHTDGRAWTGRQADMPALGFTKSLANMLLKGRVKSARGWYLDGNPKPERGGAAHPMYRPEVWNFCHVDGRTFRGTSFDLAQYAGIPRTKASNLGSGRQRVTHGWYREGLLPLPTGRGSKLPGTYGGRTVRLRHVSGAEFVGTERQACEQFALTRGNVSMVVNGKRKHTKAWTLAT